MVSRGIWKNSKCEERRSLFLSLTPALSSHATLLNTVTTPKHEKHRFAMEETSEIQKLDRLGLKACDMYERIHTEFSVIVRPGSLGLHLISDSPRGIKVVEVNEDSQYKGIIRKGDWFRSINWKFLENVTLQGFRTFLATDEPKTLIIKRSYARHVTLATATANMVAFPYGCSGKEYTSPPPYLKVSASIPSGPGTVKDLDENDTNQPLGIIWMGGRWAPMPKTKKRKYKKSAKQYEKQFGKKMKLSPTKAPKEYRLKESAALKSTPIEREKATQAITAINSASGKNNDKAASLASAHLRGVTMRPSGKWQAQFYFSGKSQYIGVFDSREKAALAYEIAREHLKEKFVRDDAHALARVNAARKAAFEGVSETNFNVTKLKGGATWLDAYKQRPRSPLENKDKPTSTAEESAHGPIDQQGKNTDQVEADQVEEARADPAEKSQVATSPFKLFHNLMQQSGSMQDVEVSGSEEDSSSENSDESSASDEDSDSSGTEVYRLEKGDGVRIYKRHKRKTFELRLKELTSFSQKHGHCNISRYTKDNPSLGRWADDTRLAYQKQENGEIIKRKLTDIEIQRLEEVGFQWVLPSKEIADKSSPKPKIGLLTKKRAKSEAKSRTKYAKPRNLTFEERFGALKAFSKEHGHTDITRSSKVDPSLGRWCEDTRYTYHNQHNGGTSKRRRKLTDDEIESLESIGFKWVLPSKLKKSGPSTTKPPSRTEAKKTANATSSNVSPKSPSLPSKMSAFDEKFLELEDFKYKYGHVDLTSQSQNNPALGNWCFNVRQALNKLRKGRRPNMKLSKEEIERLQGIGFKWNL